MPICKETNMSNSEQYSNNWEATDFTRRSVGSMEKALLVRLVLEEILAHLPLNDLLRLSLVNTTWNYVSRGVIRNQKKCILKFNPYDSSFCDLIPILESCSNNLPYNGLVLEIGCRETPPIEFQTSYETVLSKFNCQHLKILAKYSIKNSDELNILLKLAVNIKSLEVRGYLHPSIELQLTFPYLTTLIFSQEVPPQFLHQLLHSAPKLYELSGDLDPSILEYLTNCDEVQLLKEFHLKSSSASNVRDRDFATLSILYDCALQYPKLTKLVVQFDHFEDFQHVVAFREVLKLLLVSSANTLQILQIDQLSLYWLTRLDILPLKHVHSLRFGYDEELDFNLDTFSLCRIDFGYLFPSLREVEIMREYSLYMGLSQERIKEIAFDDLGYLEITPCFQVRKLTLHRAELSKSVAQVISEIFPAMHT